MRIGTDRFFHLTYCTNIHPGESWAAVFANLKQYLPPLKVRLAPDQPFGVGLRLSNAAACELLRGDALDQFRDWLSTQGLYVFTLNGFPYGGFHRQVVKDQVYAPDWNSPARVDYTLRLANILATLLPYNVDDGGISTVPISYKPWLRGQTASEAALQRVSVNLARIVAELIRIYEKTGKHLHVDLEPEPDCWLENSTDTVDFFRRWLLPYGGDWLTARLGLSRKDAQARLLTHLGVCYDACHFALQYEQPARALARLADCGIRVGKTQLSAALKVALPRSSEGWCNLSERLRPFIESTYLHQVVERRQDGSLHHHADLCVKTPPHPDARDWRIHFHVPIFIDDYQTLHSTQHELLATLSALRENYLCSHLEIETYTWDILPPDLKMDLPASIEREYRWVLGVFADALPV
jgi:hypothetical protein